MESNTNITMPLPDAGSSSISAMPMAHNGTEASASSAPNTSTLPMSTEAAQPTAIHATMEQTPVVPELQGAYMTMTNSWQEDKDVAIDKECIAKAISVIAQTSADPYVQTQEMTKIKAELLRKKYGKESKATDSKVE